MVSTGAVFARFVGEHLARGGPPDFYSHQPYEFHSLLGLACHKGLSDCVQQLLDAGAQVHWPTASVNPRHLTERVDEVYDGINLDPLGITLDMLAGLLVERGEFMWFKDPEQPLPDGVESYISIARMLVNHGANPMRPDPAYARKPLDSMLATLLEGFRVEPDLSSRQLLQEAFMIVMKACPKTAIVCLAEGRWSETGAWDCRWEDSFPNLAISLNVQAQQEVLQHQTLGLQAGRVTARL